MCRIRLGGKVRLMVGTGGGIINIFINFEFDLQFLKLYCNVQIAFSYKRLFLK